MALCALIFAAGLHPIAFPAIHVAPVADDTTLRDAMARLESFALVVFVSPNAIDFALDHHVGDWPSELAIAVLGPGSVARLAQHGIVAPAHRIIVPEGRAAEGTRFDSESLEHQIRVAFSVAGLKVLFVKGSGGREWLVQTLQANGATVETVESYQRSIGQPDLQARREVEELIRSNRSAHVIITSSEAIGYLLELVNDIAGLSGQRWLRAAQIVVPHPRIAENATAQGFTQVLLSGAGDEAIMRAIE